jgi:hypothetical protein
MRTIASGLVLVGGLFLFYLSCVHYTEPNQVAIVWNRISGELWLDNKAGFTITPPWVAVSRIDLRPQRVCITSTGRGYNCKLVRFEPSFYREFVAIQGFQYYWLNNRLSINMGYDDEYRGMKDLLRGYAYSAKKYPFVTALRDYEESQ